MKKDFILIALSVFLFSCNSKSKESLIQSTIIIAGKLAMDVPATMKFVEARGVDSYVAYLINEKDTFHIEYGDRGIINNLYKVSPSVFPIHLRESIIKRAGKEPSHDEVLFSEFAEEDEGQKIFDQNFFKYDTINGIVAKLVQPKAVGYGMTGLYLPKLKDEKSFSIYAENLDSAHHRQALQIFRTIRYK